MRVPTRSIVLAGSIIALAGCGTDNTTPTGLLSPRQSNELSQETPTYDLEVILRGDGFGHVKFRQPGDADAHTIFLGVWVRDLEPNTSYLLERAVDRTLDGNCTSTSWLTLGKGTVPQSIVTDENGTGTADLFRTLPASMVGLTFDIHFHVIRQDTRAVVLTSECYRYTVR